MELNLTADQMKRWQQLTALLNEQLIALAADVETAGTMSPTVMTALTKVRVPQIGLTTTTDRLADQTLSLLALAQGSASIATMLAAWWQVADQIMTFGTDPQQKRYLAQPHMMGLPVARASQVPVVTAMPVTDGWQLTGEVPNVVNGGTAQTYLVLAQTPPDVPTAFLVAADQPGVTAMSATTPLGLRGLAVTSLKLDQIKVTAADQLGQVGQGLAVMQRAQSLGQTFMAAVTAGILAHAGQQVRQLALTEQPPLAALTPLTATTQALALTALATAKRADTGEKWAATAALTGWLANHDANEQLSGVTGLIGDLAYSSRSPLMALQRDVQTVPFLIGTTADLADAYATAGIGTDTGLTKPQTTDLAPEKLQVSDLHRIVKKLNLTKDVPVNVGSIATAKRIIALGRGALEPAVLLQAQQLAKWIGAAIAVTQPLTMLEQFSIDQQIGTDAVTVAPEVLITLGVAGDQQFLAGMAGAEHVLAVNQDEQAPVMTGAQQVFVGSVTEFLDGMVAALN